jgi:hypothetical protein
MVVIKMAKKIKIKNPRNKAIPKDADTWVNSREDIKRLTFDMPASLHAKLKIHAVRENKTMGDVIIELLKEEL